MVRVLSDSDQFVFDPSLCDFLGKWALFSRVFDDCMGVVGNDCVVSTASLESAPCLKKKGTTNEAHLCIIRVDCCDVCVSVCQFTCKASA